MRKLTLQGLIFPAVVVGLITRTVQAGTLDAYFIGGGPVTLTGGGVIGNGGDFWNGIKTVGTSGWNIALSDTSSQSTGVSLSYSGAGGDGGPCFSPPGDGDATC